MPLRIGTRGSSLALAQTEQVCRALAGRGVEVETVIISTHGDSATDVPLHEIGGQGVFVRALDDAIVRGRIDAAVHSMKDIPALRPAGVVTAAVLERDSPNDLLVHDLPFSEMSVIGTSSTRRRAQLLRHDADLDVHGLRGNVDTRLKKLRDGQYDGIVLAQAGLDRLGIAEGGTRLPVDRFVPSPNQGTIAVVSRDDPVVVDQISSLDHPPTRQDTAMERAVMEELEGGCFTPVGIYCRGGQLTAEVLSLDGDRFERVEERVSHTDEARQAGRDLRGIADHLITEARTALGI
ncbi:MAG: hydroxymethylbilane synthase [Methanomicrobiales archaeon]